MTWLAVTTATAASPGTSDVMRAAVTGQSGHHKVAIRGAVVLMGDSSGRDERRLERDNRRERLGGMELDTAAGSRQPEPG
jgi:hypothetical protein